MLATGIILDEFEKGNVKRYVDSSHCQA
jgi:hypothetical protein